MKQKRFKKLLMSQGYDRNEANEVVKQTQKSGKKYAEKYMELLLYNNINISFTEETFTNAIKQIHKVVRAVTKAVKAFGETINDAMKDGD